MAEQTRTHTSKSHESSWSSPHPAEVHLNLKKFHSALNSILFVTNNVKKWLLIAREKVNLPRWQLSAEPRRAD